GDVSFSMRELASEVAQQSGKKVIYDLPRDQYKAALLSVGVPEGFAEVLSDADVGISKGALVESEGQLRRLIGRATTLLAAAVSARLAAAKAYLCDAAADRRIPPSGTASVRARLAVTNPIRHIGCFAAL